MCLKLLGCAVYAKQHAAPSSDVDITPFRSDLDLAYQIGVPGMCDLQIGVPVCVTRIGREDPQSLWLSVPGNFTRTARPGVGAYWR